jgi:ABC-type uncharacterized transport system involved in gliding motility auxiliary subunit
MRFADSFRAARWVRLINLILQAVLFVTFFAGLNYLSLRHNWRFELSETSRQSLSPETKSYLNQLNQPVRIIVTLTEDQENAEIEQAYRDISALLREYSYASARNENGPIQVEYMDVYQDRKKAEELGLEAANIVLLISGDHQRVVPWPEFYETKTQGKTINREAFKGEAVLTAAILDVSSAKKTKVYFIQGHGELKPDDVGERGLSQIRDELHMRNFDLAPLDLALTRKIPDTDDAAVLIIAGPQGRFQPFEEELLRNYLQTRAGRLILMVDPWRLHGLENLLFDWGVIMHDKQIFDNSPQEQDENGNLRLGRFLPHPITQYLINNTLPVIVGPARVVSEDIGRAKNDGLTVNTLIKTSPTAWGEAGYRLRSIKPEYTSGEDLRLKDGLGVLTISERIKPANNLPLSIRGGRLAVFGSSDIWTNNRISNPGNQNLFIATINWCADRDAQLNIPARPIEKFQLALSLDQLARLRLGLLFIVPGIVALLGLFVYWTRRH